MLSRIFVSALFAGAVAGLIAAALQLAFVQPVLLHAELYEGGELVHFGGAGNAAVQDLGGMDLVRDGLSVVFTMLIYTGYALMLIALMAVAIDHAGAVITPKAGMMWGVAGFVVVHLAPGFSLAPEVPGVAAADVTARQIWWFVTVAAAGVAMWLIAFKPGWLYWGLAAALLLAPHVIGAPEPDTFTGPVPTEIGALFAARAFGVGLAAWVCLGILAAYFWNKEDQASA